MDQKEFIAGVISQVKGAAEELIAIAKPKKGQIFVVGCSTSEVLGEKIGTSGSSEVASALLAALRSVTGANGLSLAVQCCEHLNRALVVESSTAERFNLTEVTVRPVPHAGGSMAAAAHESFDEPVVVETISAHLGLDIGQTLIGMHLKRVAVPVRLQYKQIGAAVLTAARTRPPLIGGERARYPEK